MTVTSIEVSTYMQAFLTVHVHTGNFVTKCSVSLYTYTVPNYDWNLFGCLFFPNTA